MGDFMADDAGDLLFAFDRFQQAGVNEDVAGRGGKRVVDIFFDDVKVVAKRLGGHFFEDALPDFIDIAFNDGVLDKGEPAGHHRQKLPGQLFLFLVGDAVAGIWQYAADEQHHQRWQWLIFSRFPWLNSIRSRWKRQVGSAAFGNRSHWSIRKRPLKNNTL